MGPLLVLDRWFWKAARDYTLRAILLAVRNHVAIEDYTSEPRLRSIDTVHELSSINEFELKSID